VDNKLVSVSSRASGEKVASIGRVLGDRSVLYKYLNPHIVVVAIASPTESTIMIYLLDNVSGHILYQLKHHQVDVSKGIKTHVVENVLYWSYYSTGESVGQSRGTRLTVAELYESREKNEKYNAYIYFNLFLTVGRNGVRSSVKFRTSSQKHTFSTIRFQPWQQRRLVMGLLHAIC
jgi:hypothetical protein